MSNNILDAPDNELIIDNNKEKSRSFIVQKLRLWFLIWAMLAVVVAIVLGTYSPSEFEQSHHLPKDTARWIAFLLFCLAIAAFFRTIHYWSQWLVLPKSKKL